LPSTYPILWQAILVEAATTMLG